MEGANEMCEDEDKCEKCQLRDSCETAYLKTLPWLCRFGKEHTEESQFVLLHCGHCGSGFFLCSDCIDMSLFEACPQCWNTEPKGFGDCWQGDNGKGG